MIKVTADVTNLTMKYYFLAKLLLGHKLKTLFESFFLKMLFVALMRSK